MAAAGGSSGWRWLLAVAGGVTCHMLLATCHSHQRNIELYQIHELLNAVFEFVVGDFQKSFRTELLDAE